MSYFLKLGFCLASILYQEVFELQTLIPNYLWRYYPVVGFAFGLSLFPSSTSFPAWYHYLLTSPTGFSTAVLFSCFLSSDFAAAFSSALTVSSVCFLLKLKTPIKLLTLPCSAGATERTMQINQSPCRAQSNDPNTQVLLGPSASQHSLEKVVLLNKKMREGVTLRGQSKQNLEPFFTFCKRAELILTENGKYNNTLDTAIFYATSYPKILVPKTHLSKLPCLCALCT